MRSWKTSNEPKVPRTPKKMDMKKLFRRNQIIITTLAVMIAAAGYLNYAGKQEAASGTDVYEAGMTDISEEDILAENQSLTGSDTNQEIASLDQDAEDIDKLAAGETDAALQSEGSVDLAANETQVANETQAAKTGLDNPGEAVLTSGMNVSEYISSVQLNREQVRAKNKETLMNLINNPNIEEAAKQQAIQEMIDMTAIAERENAAETLLLAKGFADPVVSISSGKVDVVINAPSITDPQRAQIEDIVKRKTEVGAESIVITLMKLEE
ncbi:SpoIIIAH-like family protein [Lacrimispora celerecrescens]|uniref:Stage III sporulation protein AH n=1 Tax=[Clostridium] celerecrescens 18A TaxID=1286362 RepID=A0A2M8Z017_9FIRM|nr:SpoIIIAH-like family protein [Lacrimispora celerecrescens]PJJ26786.1 stage III sporulation protein AH [[Clostridium] celerecrescens 18A]